MSSIADLERRLLEEPGLAVTRLEELAGAMEALLRTLARRWAAGRYICGEGQIDARRTLESALRTIDGPLRLMYRRRQRLREVVLLLDASRSTAPYHAFEATFAALAGRLLGPAVSLWAFAGELAVRLRPAPSPSALLAELSRVGERSWGGAELLPAALESVVGQEGRLPGRHLMVLSDFFCSFGVAEEYEAPPPALPAATIERLRVLRSIRLFDLVPRPPGCYDEEGDRLVVRRGTLPALLAALGRELPLCWHNPEALGAAPQVLQPWQVEGRAESEVILWSPPRTLAAWRAAHPRLRIVGRGPERSLIEEMFFDVQGESIGGAASA